VEGLSQHSLLFIDCAQEYDSMQTTCWHNIWATRMKVAAETRRMLAAEERAEDVHDAVTNEI